MTSCAGDKRARSTNARVRVRPIGEGDLRQILAIERASFANPWPQSQFVRELSLPFSRSVVACRASEPDLVLGYAVRWLVAGEVQLLNIAVVAGERRAGVGRTLVRWVLREARRANASLVGLEVSIRNRAARALYTSLGFVETRQRRNYYAPGDHAVIMEWTPASPRQS